MAVVKDKEFMQCFWDLAADKVELRVESGSQLLTFLADGRDETYAAYTLQRLIRGLCSPRDSARLGFSVALTQYLSIYKPEVATVLDMLDKDTKITGSMKGYEERDVMFGRLFGFAALVRSGLVTTEVAVLDIMERLIPLHLKKAWLQELCVESYLNLLTASSKEIQVILVPKLLEIIPSDVTEANESDLLLRLALQQIATEQKHVQGVIQSSLLASDNFSMSKLDLFAAPLLQSARKFPKIHRVWDQVLHEIFPMTNDRELLPLNSLTTVQREKLQYFMQFVSKLHLLNKEKKALAVALTMKLLHLVPSDDTMDLLLTDQFISFLNNSRRNTKAALHEFAGTILHELLLFAQTNTDRAKKILVAITRYGSLNFDKSTNSRLVQSLIAVLSPDALLTLVEDLCKLLGTNTAAVASSTAMKVDDDEKEEEEVEVSSVNINHNVLVMLAEIVKNRTIQASDGASLAIAVLTRIACFGPGTVRVATANESKKNKKTDKNDKKKVTFPPSFTHSLALVDAFVAEQDMEEYQPPSSLLLLTILHDKRQVIAVQESFWKVLQEVFLRDLPAHNSNLDLSEHVETLQSIQLPVKSLFTSLQEIALEAPASSASDDEPQHRTGGNKKENFCTSSIHLLTLTMVHCLSGEEIDLEIVSKAAMATHLLMTNTTSTADDEDDEGEAQVMLFDACVEFLSVSGDQAIKGLREAIKRVWSSTLAMLPDEQVSQDMLDALVDVVMGNETPLLENEDEMDVDGEEVELEEDGEDEDEVKQAPTPSKSKKGKQPQPSASKSTAAAAEVTDEDENDEEEDIMIKNEDFMDFMMVNDDEFRQHVLEQQGGAGEEDQDKDSDDDDEEGLVHHEGADAALMAFIKLKQEGRKQGLLAIQRKQILLRSRVLDILDAVLQRIKAGPLLFSVWQPMLLGVKKALTTRAMLDLPEGVTLGQRLQSLFLNTLCKKKIALKVTHDEEMEQEFVEETETLCALFQTLTQHKVGIVQKTAQEALLSFVRIILASDSSACHERVLTLVTNLWSTFATKRRSAIHGAWFEDLIVQRFPAFFLPSIWESIAAAVSTVKTSHTRQEMCEIVAAVLKKYVTVESSVQEHIVQGMPSLVQSLQKVLQQDLQLLSQDEQPPGESKKKNKSIAQGAVKRMKPVIQVLRGMCDQSIKHGHSLLSQVSGKLLKSIQAPLAEIKELPAISTMKQGTEEILALLTAVIESKEVIAEEPPQSEKKNKKKKRKSEAAVEETEQDTGMIVDVPVVEEIKDEEKQSNKQKKRKKA